jgi:CheY-like chemotaxis protein
MAHRARQHVNPKIWIGDLDWNMQPMSGCELFQQVRADPALAAIPFIMVTAESKTENVIAAKRAGVNNYSSNRSMRRSCARRFRRCSPGPSATGGLILPA